MPLLSSKPQYMKAAVLWKTGKKLKIINKIKIPELTSGQVLVKIAYSGVCHSQLMEIKGLRGKDKFVPHLFNFFDQAFSFEKTLTLIIFRVCFYYF